MLSQQSIKLCGGSRVRCPGDWCHSNLRQLYALNYLCFIPILLPQCSAWGRYNMRTCVLHYDSDAELPLCQFLLNPRARVYVTTMYNGWKVLCGYVCTSLLMPHCLVSSASIPVDGVWLLALWRWLSVLIALLSYLTSGICFPWNLFPITLDKLWDWCIDEPIRSFQSYTIFVLALCLLREFVPHGICFPLP